MLREEYEILITNDDKKQAELRVAMRKWLKYEQELVREAYKSNLAQNSLEMIVSGL